MAEKRSSSRRDACPSPGRSRKPVTPCTRWRRVRRARRTRGAGLRRRRPLHPLLGLSRRRRRPRRSHRLALLRRRFLLRQVVFRRAVMMEEPGGAACWDVLPAPPLPAPVLGPREPRPVCAAHGRPLEVPAHAHGKKAAREASQRDGPTAPLPASSTTPLLDLNFQDLPQ